MKTVEEKVILDTDYADDMAIMDNSGEGLQESTDLLVHYSSYAGLRINAKKSEDPMHGCKQVRLPATFHQG